MTMGMNAAGGSVHSNTGAYTNGFTHMPMSWMGHENAVIGPSGLHVDLVRQASDSSSGAGEYAGNFSNRGFGTGGGYGSIDPAVEARLQQQQDIIRQQEILLEQQAQAYQREYDERMRNHQIAEHVDPYGRRQDGMVEGCCYLPVPFFFRLVAWRKFETFASFWVIVYCAALASFAFGQSERTTLALVSQLVKAVMWVGSRLLCHHLLVLHRLLARAITWF